MVAKERKLKSRYDRNFSIIFVLRVDTSTALFFIKTFPLYLLDCSVIQSVIFYLRMSWCDGKYFAKGKR